MTFRRRIIVAMLPCSPCWWRWEGREPFCSTTWGTDRRDPRQNYDSVVYMRDLNEALERIDSSFQFALAGREKQSHKQYQANWKLFEESHRQGAT